MLNDEQHEKLKKLTYQAIHADTWQARKFAREDMADIIDPEHWNRGLYMKTRNPGRLPDEELNDVYKPNSQREFTPRRAEG